MPHLLSGSSAFSYQSTSSSKLAEPSRHLHIVPSPCFKVVRIISACRRNCPVRTIDLGRLHRALVELCVVFDDAAVRNHSSAVRSLIRVPSHRHVSFGLEHQCQYLLFKATEYRPLISIDASRQQDTVLSQIVQRAVVDDCFSLRIWLLLSIVQW